MPAATGGTPRKILPPPITTPISTPCFCTPAISATMPSMVARLMPYAPSPIKASPESLSRMRLYLGFMLCAGLFRHGRDFGCEVRRWLFVDALAHHEEAETQQLCLLCREHLLHRLLVVLDEGLAEQRRFREEFIQPAFDHLGDNPGRLARLLGPRREDAALTIHNVDRNFALGEIRRPGEGN